MSTIKQMSLDKAGHRYVFRYQAGGEAEVIGAFATLAEDQETDFDWFDAAVLSYQMGRRIEFELDEDRS